MSTALTALAGVIAGSIVTGGVQSAIASFDRRRSSRIAARLLYMQLWWAKNAVNGLSAELAWNSRIDWERFVSSWIEHRVRLAQRLGTPDFLAVSTAFTCVEQLALFKSDDLANLAASPSAPALGPNVLGFAAKYDPYIRRAMVILNRASWGWWEWWRKRDSAKASQREAEGLTPFVIRGQLEP
jgi:hypothetical protein